MKIRKAQFSGSWYPGDAADCEREITSFIKSGKEATESDRPLLGGIVPHAGWYFSGSIACNVIHRLLGEKLPDVFVVFGMHLHPRSPNHIMIEGAWETPFGNLEIEEDLAGELTKQFKFNIESANRFTPDNTIELQLPFIKYFFNDAKLVPIGVPPNRESLRIGQAVHLPDKDVRGMLKRAWIVDRGPNNEDLVTAVHHVPFYATDREESLRGMMQISGKTEIETDRNVYFLEVDDLVYLTSCVSVRHGIVCVASEYLGAPVPYAIYYVTENTKLRDVTCTLKYFTSRVKFVTKSGCKFQSLYESRNAKRSDPETDLTNKLSNDVPR